MKEVFKVYTQPFLLEPTKLTRLMEVIHARLEERSSLHYHDRFEVFMKGDRREVTDTLEGVLSLENSKKHRIERLIIASFGSKDESLKPDYEVHVDFGMTKGTKGESTTTTITTRSDEPTWNGSTLSAVEEQVERTKQQLSLSVVTAAVILIGMLVILLTQFVTFNERRDLSRYAWLDETALDRVQKIANENRAMTEDEIREVTTSQFRNILLYQRPPEVQRGGMTRRAFFIGLPIVAIIGCASFLLITCYPTKVFLWGDEVERYARITQRRRLLWGVITGVMVVGLLGKFLSEGILAWIPKE